MKTHIAMLSLGLAIFMASCGGGPGGSHNHKPPGQTEDEEQKAGSVSETSPPPANSEPQMDNAANSQTPGFFSSSAAQHNPNDTIHKFIRTADMKFRVQNVMRATLGIEDIVLENGGFVILSDLRSEKGDVKRIRISRDSSLEIISFRTENYMTLRIPVEELDQVLRGIGNFSVYMDHRLIKAEDVRLKLMANKLEQKRQQNYQSGVSKSAGNNLSGDDRILYSQQAEDRAKLENLALEDQMDYSTIQILIYQDENESRHVIYTPVNEDEYERGMGERLSDAFSDGWSVIKFFIVLLARLWPFLVIILGVSIIVWVSGKKSKGKS